MTIDHESVVPTMSTLTHEEYRQMGRNSVDQVEATFIALLLAFDQRFGFHRGGDARST